MSRITLYYTTVHSSGVLTSICYNLMIFRCRSRHLPLENPAVSFYAIHVLTSRSMNSHERLNASCDCISRLLLSKRGVVDELLLFIRDKGQIVYLVQATAPIMAAARPSSSARMVILTVSPLFASAILTWPATLPPCTLLPYSLRVCVALDRTTSVPSRGCRDSVWVSCSVASRWVVSIAWSATERRGLVRLTC